MSLACMVVLVPHPWDRTALFPNIDQDLLYARVKHSDFALIKTELMLSKYTKILEQRDLWPKGQKKLKHWAYYRLVS